MTEAPRLLRPPLPPDGPVRGQVDTRGEAWSAVDPRISMVLAVLGGRAIEDVAAEWDVLPTLLHRWVADFLVAGSSVITNRPDPDATRQRDRFMVALAHELRTPMAVARGWAMTLANGGLSAHRATDSLERLLSALSRLSEHIVDVELAATSSLGLMQLRLEPVTVADLCLELADCPGVREGAEVTIQADPGLLGRVLRDLWAAAHRSPAPGTGVHRRRRDGVVARGTGGPRRHPHQPHDHPRPVRPFRRQ